MNSNITRASMSVLLAASLVGGATLGAASLAVAAPSTVSAASDTSAPVMDSFQLQIFNLTNQHRLNNGVAPLTWSNSIANVAQNWTNYQIENNQWKHNPNFAAQYPAGHTAAGENIAANEDAEAVFLSWVNSEGHNANLLNPAFTEMGVGYGLQTNSAYEYAGMYYVTQNLAGYPVAEEPPVEEPPVEEPTPVDPEPTTDPTPVDPEPTTDPTPVDPEPTTDPTPVDPEPTTDPTPVDPEPTTDPTPVDPEPTTDPTPVDPEPTTDPTPVDPEPTTDPTPVDPEPTTDPTPVDPEPTTDPTPVDPEPTTDPTPVDPEPTTDPTPVDPEPTTDPTPVDPEPTTDPTPVNPEPTTDPTPVDEEPAPADKPINFTEANQGDLTGEQTGDWTIVVGNLQPNTAYDFVLFSDPTALGTLTTDANGQVTINVPTSTESGIHHVAVYSAGAIAAGETQEEDMLGWVAFEVDTTSTPVDTTNPNAPGADGTAPVLTIDDTFGTPTTDTNGDGTINEDDLAQTAAATDENAKNGVFGAIAAFLLASGLFVARGAKLSFAGRKH